MSSDLKEQMTQLYQRMYELTAPECGKCRIPYSCCSPEYCEMAADRAAEFGVTLTPTGHDRLPYMGETGCVVPPVLRPLCTLHTCDVSGLGFKRDDPLGEWTATYFNLRDQIDVLEAQWFVASATEENDNDG